MSSPFTIAALQQDIAWSDKQENLLTTAHNLNRIRRGTDLVVLPELFTTGYIADATLLPQLAETNDGHTVDDLHRWADYFHFAIAGSFLATDGHGNFYNRGFFVEPGGEKYFYDKHHLFSMSTEADLFTPGERISRPVRYRGWNIKLLICYDVRFPVWCRKVDNDYDILLFPANWPSARLSQFRQLLAARAVENNAIVVGCNRIGSDDAGEYPEGGSAIYDLQGREVSTADEYGNLYATFDRDRFVASRDRFPTYRDADPFRLLDL
ncbi:MAG: nitrilase family protein [Muribaculaceae bacterium]|nr:nitrilase family protein [Muribaculaceae bacterium]